MKAIGQLNAGVSIEVARQDMNRVSRDLGASYPNADSNETANLVALKEAMVGDTRAPLLILLGAVSFVLLIACVNVSESAAGALHCERAGICDRIAIGGGQWRIIRQLLTESIFLALAGGGIGLLLAQFKTQRLWQQCRARFRAPPRFRSIGASCYLRCSPPFLPA